MMIPSAREENK